MPTQIQKNRAAAALRSAAATEAATAVEDTVSPEIQALTAGLAEIPMQPSQRATILSLLADVVAAENN